MSKSQFTYVIYIRTTAERLWQALTAPDDTRRYWFETWQDCRWEVGARWLLMSPDGRVADSGVVWEVESPRRLVISWQHQLLPEMRAEGHSRMTCELERRGEAVKLTVAQEIDKADSKLIAAFSSGWPPILSSLKSMLETGEPLEETRYWPKGM